MAGKSSSGGQKRAQGGGRTPNSEPRIQLFKDFGGINFENLGSWDGIRVDQSRSKDDQTDLQMNFVTLQNNVSLASNKTFETRPEIIELFKSPSGVTFTGPVCLIGSSLYAAKSDQNIGRGNLYDAYSSGPITINSNVTIESHTSLGHSWSSLDYYDNQLIGLTSQREIFTGEVNSSYIASSIENAIEIPNPNTDFTGHLSAKGSLSISPTATEACPFRITIAHTYVNKFGPTRVSPNTIFYANHPVSEWHAGCYLAISGSVPSGYDIKAVELYYATDNAMDMLFLGRVDVAANATSWSYNWFGYVDATSMWPMANLIAPTENYTRGVRASKVKTIDGRMYFYGDSSNPQRLYIGGNPGNLLSISPGTGGGFVDVEPGTQESIRHVCKYKTQSGNSIVTMLCDSPNSKKEQRFNLVENSISLSNEQSMKSWQAEQVAGAVGCKSYDGALVCQDGLYSVSRYGLALTTMTMEYNSQIRTNYVSDAIKPVFTQDADIEMRLEKAMLLEVDGVLYMAMGNPGSYSTGNIDNVLFCYDIDLKAWWTYTLDVDEPILNLFHVDHVGTREGIGIVTRDKIYVLPTTGEDDDDAPTHDFLIQTGQLSTQMPQQGWQYLSQLEFHFDHFVGEIDIEVRGYDMFGRNIKVTKHIEEEDEIYDYIVHMRIDQRLMSYVITMTGKAQFRLTHWLARVYTLSNKVGQVWGFDDSISHRSSGSVHPTFKCYNDIRKAIFV